MHTSAAQDLENETGALAPLADGALRAAIDQACARIAPTWPLDRFIAVNPFLGYLDMPLPAAANRLSAEAGSRLLMPRSWYREQWDAGRLQEVDLREAIARTGAGCTVERLRQWLRTDELRPPRRARMTDVVDAGRDLSRRMSWCEFVTHSLSRFCAAWFDDGQSKFGPERSGGLYPAWRRRAVRDLTPPILMGLKSSHSLARSLPDTPEGLIAYVLEELGVRPEHHVSYLSSLLYSLNGWAAWCAGQRWQARLEGADDDQIVHLLAMRLAWEWMLWAGVEDAGLQERWRAAVAHWTVIDGAAAATQDLDWLLQHAMEIAWQRPVCAALSKTLGAAATAPAPAEVQAAFCIDVRSEVYRRALEASDSGVHTLGFAGFFGLPVEYRPLGAQTARPQLPGLLAPALTVADQAPDARLAARRRGRLDLSTTWKDFKTAAVSGFSFVETLGLLYGGRLLSDSLGRSRPVPHHEHAGLKPGERACVKPRLVGPVNGEAFTVTQQADLAAGILRAMSLTHDFAPLVLLAGHGSETVNNPHAAGLDCGACCGQTGEVNARALAALLNDPAVREALHERGIAVPDETWFLAGLHNTTTDELQLFDLDAMPAGQRDRLARLQRALAQAGRRARAERAGALGLEVASEGQLLADLTRRAGDWSEVRPEWGLANCAALIVAPRERSRSLNLRGRSFLHEYRWEQDEGFGILELIMTAPMVVTHWINMQYYASTVDNALFGSGNKVLHNVVGGHIGVFEGNGGDLRIGLPLQSVHDGKQWVHTPLRLSVFIEAPAEAIERVLSAHPEVRRLAENGWLHLFRLDTAEGQTGVWQYGPGGWAPAPGAMPAEQTGRLAS